MPSLNWIGKEAVANHNKEVPFRLLKKIKSVSVGEASQNLIIHGDNLEALKALMPYYAGKIKCIYIDPPYNTGNESWIYNDKVNSPKIKKWLGKVVGRESEDLNRHDKWLCMMYPRLKLLKDFLRDDGAIFISIDYNEEAHLRLLLDDIFGAENYRNTFVVARIKKNIQEREKVRAINFGYNSVFFYAKSDKCLIFPPKKIQKKDDRWHAFDAPGVRSTMEYEIFGVKPPKGRHWMYVKLRVDEMIKNGEIRKNPKTGSIQYLLKASDYTLLDTNWTDIQESRSDWNFNNGEKNPDLVKRIIKLVDDPEIIILDSFAGSGTTGHAVLDLNKEDGGSRKFIMVEMEDAVAKDITAERIKLAIKKYNYNGGFEYCELSKPLFDENGQIDEECDFNQLATYIYFTETKTNIDPKEISGHFIGGFNGVEYYLLFKGKNKNILDRSFLNKIKKDSFQKVVYADNCLLNDKIMEQYNLIFKQIPYEIRVY